MKAAVFHAFGPPDVLEYEDVPDPFAGPGEVVVRVHAVTVNRTLDCLVRQGHVLNAVFGVGVEGIGHYHPMGEAAEGQGRDELGGPITHDGVHQCACLHELAGQVQRLVAGDAPGYS